MNPYDGAGWLLCRYLKGFSKLISVVLTSDESVLGELS